MTWYSDVLQKSPEWHSPQACYDPKLLFPPFRAVCDRIIARAAGQGEVIRYGETFRSPARQLYLRAKGLSQLKVGTHQFGLAADFIRLVDGRYDPLGQDYVFLLALCNAEPCPWGRTISGVNWGDDTRPISAEYFHDWDHCQGCLESQQAALFDGSWYPPE